MDFPPFVVWAVVVVLAILVFAWHWSQSQAFAKKLKAAGRENDALSRKLLGLSFDRAIQVLFLWGVVLSVLVYSQQKQAAPLLLQIDALKADLAYSQEQLEAAQKSEGPQLEAVVDTGSEEYQARLDKLKENFEQLYINYHYLKRCGLAKADDFHLMNSALLHSLSELNAPSNLQYNIQSAAKGSYDEMYAESPCSAEVTTPIKQNVDAYLQSVRTNLAQ